MAPYWFVPVITLLGVIVGAVVNPLLTAFNQRQNFNRQTINGVLLINQIKNLGKQLDIERQQLLTDISNERLE